MMHAWCHAWCLVPCLMHRCTPSPQYMDWDPFFRCCQNEFMAVGGVFRLDLTALPPSARKAGSWTVYQVGWAAAGAQCCSGNAQIVAHQQQQQQQQQQQPCCVDEPLWAAAHAWGRMQAPCRLAAYAWRMGPCRSACSSVLEC